MTTGIVLRIIQVGHQLSLAGSRRRFEHALRSCEAAQSARLKRLVTANANSAYGRAYKFDAVRSVRTWQDRVPIVEYDDLQPWVERAATGEPGVLTSQPVRIFERTSGSTAANKLIPYTTGLLDDFSAATGPWLHDLYSSYPNLRGTSSYWSITPATRQRERTAGGAPIGFDDETEYFGRLERYALRQMFAVPATVARIPDGDAWAGETTRHLVAADNLGLISVWHPSFLLLLLRRIEANLDALLGPLPSRRRAAVADRLDRGAALSEALWPQLNVVSCWADAAAAGALPSLARAVPHARIQPKGLLATEGVVSFPLHGSEESGAVAAVTGHFLEFMSLEHPTARPRLAHELQPGATYVPILSTAGGFYRYRLGDAVRCVTFHEQVPALRFEGRIDHVSDLCGEKLNPRLVSAAIEYGQRVVAQTLDFALLAPVAGDPPGYCLYVDPADDSTLDRLRAAVEGRLSESHGYRYARALGQLAPLRAVAVRDGAARFILARRATGQRAGDIKPAHLDTRLDWHAVFESSADGISSRIEVTS